jgi:hypothetical protein
MAAGKNWLEVALMPVVVAGVGVIGTYFITEQQTANSAAMAESERNSTIKTANAEREIKAIEIFTEHFVSGDDDQRSRALRLLGLVNPGLGKRGSEEVSSWGAETAMVQKAAEDVTRKSAETRILAARVYIHIQQESDRAGSNSVAKILKDAGFIVPGT